MVPTKTSLNKIKIVPTKTSLTKVKMVPKSTEIGSKFRKIPNNTELRSKIKKVHKNTEIGTKIKVMLRCRASNGAPSVEPPILEPVSNDPKKILLKANNTVYCFDQIFDQNSTQEQIYENVASPVVKEVFKGYSCTIFAYGQTGTGKTFTMEGSDKQEGIIPRVIKELFLELQKKDPECHVTISMLELYNEEIRDLLGFSDDHKFLNIYEDGTGVKVQNLKEHAITSVERGIEMMKYGVKKRMTAATNINDKSSRSHSIFTITVYLREVSPNGDVVFKVGKLNLVDLAGSENGKNSGSENLRAREAANINRSLLTLGRVINSLVENTPHVPYRESKLTRLLKDSLGGYTKTYIIATVSPDQQTYDEIRSTLDYASHANGICNLPQANNEVSHVKHVTTLVQNMEQMDQELQINYDKQGVYQTKKAYDATKLELLTAKEALIAEKIDKENQKNIYEEMKSDIKKLKEAVKRARDEKERTEQDYKEKVNIMKQEHKGKVDRTEQEHNQKRRKIDLEYKSKEQNMRKEIETLQQKNQALQDNELNMQEHIEALQQNNQELVNSMLAFKQSLNKEIDSKWESFMETINNNRCPTYTTDSIPKN